MKPLNLIFQQRFNDLKKNSFLIQSIVLIFFEYFLLFTFAIWSSFFVYYQIIPEVKYYTSNVDQLYRTSVA